MDMKGFLVAMFIELASLLSSGIESREMSQMTQRAIRDSLGVGARNFKKVLVDFETDVVSAFSPYSLHGTRYPWKVFTPKLAENQIRIIETQNYQRSLANGNRGRQLLSSDLNDVKFYIHQDHWHSGNGIIIDTNTDPFSQGISQVGPNDQVKILIHGFQSGPELPFQLEAKNAYLKETNHTVMVVDWEGLSQPRTRASVLLYPAVTENALRVGELVAHVIDYLMATRVIIDLNQIHIIGHSLGAHAAGKAGNLIANKYGRKLGRITALDPAFLAFIGTQEHRRIDKNDARFVDAIHTSGLSIYDPVGHVDFYPNGGRNQVSCYNHEGYQGNGKATGDNDAFSRTFEKIIQSCSHAKSYYFYISTIKKENVFWACKCVNWKDYRTFCRDSCTHRERLGEYVSHSARGRFYLDIST